VPQDRLVIRVIPHLTGNMRSEVILLIRIGDYYESLLSYTMNTDGCFSDGLLVMSQISHH